jgi:RNA polymerase sigma factor (sigma-70 family)
MSEAKANQGILARPALRLQPDARLVRLAREGSERALEEIVRRYRPPLVRYAATIVPADRADDVVQDSLARALPHIGSGSQELHLRAWLYRIVRNSALNNLRDAGPPHEQLDESYDGVEQPPQAIDRRERVRALVEGIRGLPQPQREALVKREMEGLSHSRIATELGVSAGAARQLIYRARQALRDGLGLLIPMPLVRYLVERGTLGEAGAAGGGALALKATVAMLATGAAVTAGVALKPSQHHSHRQARDLAERSSGGASATGSPSRQSRRPLSSPTARTTGGGARAADDGRAADGEPLLTEDRLAAGGARHGGAGGSQARGGGGGSDAPTAPERHGGSLSGSGPADDGGGEVASDAGGSSSEGPGGGGESSGETSTTSGEGETGGETTNATSSSDGGSEGSSNSGPDGGSPTLTEAGSSDSGEHVSG